MFVVITLIFVPLCVASYLPWVPHIWLRQSLNIYRNIRAKQEDIDLWLPSTRIQVHHKCELTCISTESINPCELEFIQFICDLMDFVCLWKRFLCKLNSWMSSCIVYVYACAVAAAVAAVSVSARCAICRRRASCVTCTTQRIWL